MPPAAEYTGALAKIPFVTSVDIHAVGKLFTVVF